MEPADIVQNDFSSSNSHGTSTSTVSNGNCEKIVDKTVHTGGVRLKRFEHVVATLLQNNIYPTFVQLPTYCTELLSYTSCDDTNNKSSNDTNIINLNYYTNLPNWARVLGSLPGQISNPIKAHRKEQQIQSMLRCIIPFIQQQKQQQQQQQQENKVSIVPALYSDTISLSTTSKISNIRKQKVSKTIVDFGGGSGHLSIPLALILQKKKHQQQHVVRRQQKQHQQQFEHIITENDDDDNDEYDIEYNVVCVDLNQHSLNLLHTKCQSSNKHSNPISAAQSTEYDTTHNNNLQKQLHLNTKGTCVFSSTSTSNNNCTFRQCSTISNLFTFHGSIEQYMEHVNRITVLPSLTVTPILGLDIALALHLCGEGTDVVIRLSIQQHIDTIIVAPCCVGKLQSTRKNPYIYQSTGQNIPTIKYPQSNIFRTILSPSQEQVNIHCLESHDSNLQQQENETTSASDTSTDGNDNDVNAFNSNNSSWNALAKAADYSDNNQSRTTQNAIRRTAKSLLEYDRQLYIKEQCNGIYQTRLVRMIPWDASPKNDIIIVWKQQQQQSQQQQSQQQQPQDEQSQKSILQVPMNTNGTLSSNKIVLQNNCDSILTNLLPDKESQNDIEVAKIQLLAIKNSAADTTDVSATANDSSVATTNNSMEFLLTNTSSSSVVEVNNSGNENNILHEKDTLATPINCSIDWTPEEENEIRQVIQNIMQQEQEEQDNTSTTTIINIGQGSASLSSSFSNTVDTTTTAAASSTSTRTSTTTYIFPTGMGSRKRKLIHYIAEQYNIKHWGIGTKNSEKTVAIAIAVKPSSTTTTTTTICS